MMGKKYAYHDWQGYDSLVPFKDADYPGSEQGTVKSDLGDYLLYGRGNDKGVIMKWFDEGLSGWRLDVAKEVPPGFWADVRKEVKSIKTKNGDDPLLLGEIWQDGSQFFTGDTFDSVMNYKLSFALGDLFLDKGDAKAADDELTILRQNYPKEALYDLMNIVDSTIRSAPSISSVAAPTAWLSRRRRILTMISARRVSSSQRPSSWVIQECRPSTMAMRPASTAAATPTAAARIHGAGRTKNSLPTTRRSSASATLIRTFSRMVMWIRSKPMAISMYLHARPSTQS